MESWKRYRKTPLIWSGHYLKVLPQIPSGPWQFLTLICLISFVTLTWSITVVLSEELSDTSDCCTLVICGTKQYFSKWVKQALSLFGNASLSTPSRLTLELRGPETSLTVAVFLMPCHAARRLSPLNFKPILYLHFSFVFLNPTSQFTCFCPPVLHLQSKAYFLFI